MEEEVAIGDCVVFEEGVFEDPYLHDNLDLNAQKTKRKKPNLEIQPENLIPEKWKEVQEQINITKKERRKIAQQLEYGSRIEKNKQGLVPMSEEEYLSYRETKLAQLKPLVLNNPTSFPVEEKEAEAEAEPVEEKPHESTSSRVVPRNPRRAVYGGTLEDISDFFNSGSYQPGGNAATQGVYACMYIERSRCLCFMDSCLFVLVYMCEAFIFHMIMVVEQRGILLLTNLKFKYTFWQPVGAYFWWLIHFLVFTH